MKEVEKGYGYNPITKNFIPYPEPEFLENHNIEILWDDEKYEFIVNYILIENEKPVLTSDQARQLLQDAELLGLTLSENLELEAKLALMNGLPLSESERIQVEDSINQANLLERYKV